MRAAKGEGSITRRPNGTWRGYVTVDGARRYFSAPTKAEAAQRRRALLAQREGGELSVERSPTVKAWIEHWLSISDHRPSTLAGYRYSIDHYIVPSLGSTRLDRLTIEQVERLYLELADRGLSGSTIHQCHAILRVALKQAVWRGKVGRNVAALVKAPRVQRPDTTALSEADAQAIFTAAVGTPYEARWHLSLALGLRPGEATGVEWGDLDLEARTIHVHQQLQSVNGRGTILVPLPKTSAGDRVIRLPGYLVDLLHERRAMQLQDMAHAGDSWESWEWEGQPRAFVFTQRSGAPLRASLDATEWRRLVAAAGLPPTRRYTARHTAASVMIANGVDVATVADTLGHASPSFTMNVYVHALDERKDALADMLDQRNAQRERLSP